MRNNELRYHLYFLCKDFKEIQQGKIMYIFDNNTLGLVQIYCHCMNVASHMSLDIFGHMLLLLY